MLPDDPAASVRDFCSGAYIDRLDPRKLAKFLAFADKVDPAEIINHLRASVAARAVKAARDAVGSREDEASLLPGG